MASLILACGEDTASTKVQSSDNEKPLLNSRLKADSSGIPISSFQLYLNDFHFFSGNRASQQETHHYCSQLSEDVTQCVIFDGNARNAKLTGVEYIISERLFKTLPEDEKKLWHSYRYLVKGGLLVAPNLSDEQEHDLMGRLVSAYGKTWQTWQNGSNSKLPLGGPALLMSFTRDGQLDPDLLKNRDKRLHIESAEKRQLRSDILGRASITGADSWENGPAIQLPALVKRNQPDLQKDTLR
ncbi:OBAP family protein [Larkinella terrae]|uniref:OBAP family protein n=1 Tax=Larkinella terrae TaxID=2025311 RepID=UPI00197FD777|nr:OBAP family protein [Larkinella terrae]